MNVGGGRHNPDLCTLRGWGDMYVHVFDIRFVTCHIAGTAVDLTVPMEDYHEYVRLVREYRQAHPLE